MEFAVWSPQQPSLELECDGRRYPMLRGAGNLHRVTIAGAREGSRYTLIAADGRSLMDPRAYEIDSPWQRNHLPHAVVRSYPEVPRAAPLFPAGGLIYEVAVRSFTMLHPDVPPEDRGKLRALQAPAVIRHLKKLGVNAVELMPLQAWIDELHLVRLGLRNVWGYNSMNFFALDPRLAPGGLAELCSVTETLHAEGIAVILDVVFNHTGEGDDLKDVWSWRGLADHHYYRHLPDGRLANDSGCGNTLNCADPHVLSLVLDALRHYVQHAGVDGFRFDLAPILGRTPHGFDPHAPFFRRLLQDDLLADRIFIAEPWDVGPGGYQLGRFPPQFLEWNDRYRDDVRRFWRGDAGAIGNFVTRLAGSQDVFGGAATRTVNYIASHDGFTLRDLATYAEKRNHANGEANRDGTDANFSWQGAQGDTRALLATLFASRGAIMLTAGDEFGRTQHGNNNAYCQDNHITWLDWIGRDRELEDYTASLSALRRRTPALRGPGYLSPGDVTWLQPDGRAFHTAAWNDPHSGFVAMRLNGITVTFDRRGQRTVQFTEDSPHAA